MAKPIEVLSTICSVPGTDEPLEFSRGGAARSRQGQRFRGVRGVPILRSEEPAVVTKPKSDDAGGMCQEHVDYLSSLSGYTLMLGAGHSRFSHPRVIDVEYDLYESTDVVADAHLLPFRSNTFELFFAMNVVEHLRKPPVAIGEALRVLRPGGEVLLHAAFLQPLHEQPSHYFNATEHGLREWFRDFDAVECSVSPNFNPLYALSWLSHDLLAIADHHLGSTARSVIGSLRLDELAGFWQRPDTLNPATLELFFKLPEAAQRRIAAGFELRARKPQG